MKASTMRTYTGRRFYHSKPRARDICIRDIAHALSLMCRYTGHVPSMYSVAEHSVRVSRLFKDHDLALWALLHDASEAYYADMHRYLKRMPGMACYREMERRCMLVVARKYRLTPCRAKEPSEVQQADRVMALTEMRDLKGRKMRHKEMEGLTPLRGTIKPWSSKRAERAFLKRFAELY